MRMRAGQRMRSIVFGGLLAMGIASEGVARAEADVFGVGDGHSGAKTVAGDEVVNAYAPITADVAAGATQITFGAVRGDAGGFAAGDLVMVWRATGVATTEVGQRFTDRVQLSSAAVAGGTVGTYEFARVSVVTGSTMTLTKPLVRAFAKDVSQVVKVPEYTTLSIPAGTSLKAAPWAASGTGFSGGILAVLANDAITLDGKLDADGAGFRGGQKVQRLLNLTNPCTQEDGTPADGFANKGEGVVRTEFGTNKGGRGNWSLAAGGGNCQESGGGGGGNFGAGGVGGDSFLSSGRGGRGGLGIDYSLLERITMGGGGGAGEQKNGVGSSGGAGGGAIFVRGKSMSGAGTFTAIGENAANAGILGVESDGAGGGGAGGSVLVRIVDNADCGGLVAKGGTGGNTTVIGLGFWGPGGGGGGGRVLVQAKAVGTACKADVTPGAAGASGGTPRGQAGGVVGQNETPPAGAYCFSNPPNAADAQCTDPKPVCDVAKGTCENCNGAYGSNATLACPVAGEPTCLADGSCVACSNDFNLPGAAPCQLSAQPYCEVRSADPNVGKCGKCDDDGDCVGPTHPGPKCHVAAGACGTQCTKDSDCKGSEWCSQNICIPKTPNGQPVSNLPPDTNGQCTPPVGQRTCASGVCEEDDDLCGLKNGSDCDGKNERCRSTICFPKDDRCGLPTGEPCTGDGQCRSAQCKNGVCTGCDDDTDCPADKQCDKAKKECVPRADAGADAGANDAGAGDAGDPYQAGLVEGGGCSCRTSVVAASPPLAMFAGAFAALFAVRRRRSNPR